MTDVTHANKGSGFSLRLVVAAVVLFFSSTALARLEVVATTTSLGMLASEIGGDKVSVSTLAPPDRDIHYLQAKPSMMLTLRNADLLVAMGAELEIGWLPAAVRSSTNGKLQPGESGYFEATAHTTLADQGIADRSQGDVHPQGNPHIQLDPVRMKEVADALTEKLAGLDKTNGDYYRARGAALGKKLNGIITGIRENWQPVAGALLMHKSPDYLLQRLQVPIYGYLEPVPGVPPTAAHIKTLQDKLKGKPGVIIHAPYHQDDAAKALANELGWQRKALATEPKKGAVFSDYRQMILQWAQALSQNAS